MENSQILTLENGLKVVLYQDNTKHVTEADLIIKYGGIHKQLKTNNEIINIPNGVAHFLEHILVEHNMYGNILTIFYEKNIIANAFTSNNHTCFYIDTVKEFEENLVKLINYVNKRVFTEEDVEVTRKAIIKERMMYQDHKKVKLERKMYESLFHNIEFPNTLGEIDEIKNISYETLSTIYDLVYQPQNQILVISGNFDKDKIISLITETYNSLKKERKDFEIIRPIEPNETKQKLGIAYDDIHNPIVNLSYKINIKNLTKFEKLQLDFMMYWFLNTNFSAATSLYNNLVNKNICSDTIHYYTFLINDFIIINIGTSILNNEEEFINTIKQAINDKIYNEDDFNLRKKETIVQLILREDSLHSKVSPFVDNIVNFDYDHMDTIEDIENITFEKYKNAINSLDFSNYSIIKLEKE